MDRRSLLIGAMAAGCAGSEGGVEPPASSEPSLDTGRLDTGTPVEPTDTMDGPELAAGVPRSLAVSDRVELDVALNVVSGEVPAALLGHAFLVHAIPYADGSPVFAGDGKVLRLDFSAEGVSLKSRILKTDSQRADQGSLGQPYGFANDGLVRMSNTLGVRNFANTALVPMGDRMVATSDAGRPVEIDPTSLEVISAVGRRDEWEGMLPDWIERLTDWPFPVHMTTAHPAFVDGKLFTVNYGLPMLGGEAFVRLIEWDGSGDLVVHDVVQPNGFPLRIDQSVHQMAVTESYVVILDTAFVVEIAVFGSADPIPASPDTAIHMIRRSDLATDGPVTAYTTIIPREAVHFLAEEDASGNLILHLAHNCAADPSEMLTHGDLRAGTGEGIDPELAGIPSAPTDLGAMSRYVIDGQTATVISADVVFDEVFWGGPALVATPEESNPDWLLWASVGFEEELRLERVEQMYADYPHRRVALADLPASRPSTLCRTSTADASVIDRYSFPQGRVGMSPSLLGGFAIVAVVSDDTETEGSSGDEFWVFDASDLAAGPLARLAHPDLSLPFTLHTATMASLTPHSAAYRVDPREDYASSVAGATSAVQALFEDWVYS